MAAFVAERANRIGTFDVLFDVVVDIEVDGFVVVVVVVVVDGKTPSLVDVNDVDVVIDDVVAGVAGVGKLSFVFVDVVVEVVVFVGALDDVRLLVVVVANVDVVIDAVDVAAVAVVGLSVVSNRRRCIRFAPLSFVVVAASLSSSLSPISSDG